MSQLKKFLEGTITTKNLTRFGVTLQIGNE